jgi:Fe-S-cluster-containing hydrogenase component 2
MDAAAHGPRVDQENCTLCGLCVQACPCRSIEIVEQRLVFHCLEGCSHGVVCSGGNCWCVCEEICPEGANECPFEIVLGTDGEGGFDAS